MTFKEQYKKAMDGIVPSEDFSSRLKLAVAGEAADAQKLYSGKKADVIKFKRRYSTIRKVVAGILSAACIVVIAGVAIYAVKSAGSDLTGENMFMAAPSTLSSYYAAQEGGAEEGAEEEAAAEKAENKANGDLFLEMAPNPSDGNMEKGETEDFVWDERASGAIPVTGGAALNTYVKEVSAESIAVERNDNSNSETDSEDDWVLLCVSSKDVEAFAETLYNSVAYSMVEEIESSLAGASDSSDPVYELCLKLSDGSSLRLAVSASGVIVVEDLHMIVYMECGNEAFLKVWNACVDVQ